jgi:hypothetical protein
MIPEKITIGILNHDNDVYEKYVAQSLKKLQGDYDLMIEKNKNPAQAYNDIIDKSINRYIVFLHADVTFSHEFINNINQSIDRKPDFGAFCCVGVKRTLFGKVKIITSTIDKQRQVVTSDSCCLVINKEHNLLFDANLFDEYHMYIEDYCTQVRLKLNLNIYTLLTNWFWISEQKPSESIMEKLLKTFKLDYQKQDEFNHDYLLNADVRDWFVHYGDTFLSKGAKWGKWNHYKIKLNEKWGEKILTT